MATSNNQIQTKNNNNGITSFLSHDKTQEYLKSVIGKDTESFVTNLVSIVNQNPALQECTNKSLMSGAIIATTLNLSLNKGFGYAYLVPFNNNKAKVKEAQFQLGYKGYIQLAMRTGQYKRLNATPIYENQFISWDPIEEELELNKVEGDGKVVGYVAFFKLLNGFEKKMYWSYDKMINHADQFSMAFRKSEYIKLLNNEIPKNELWKYSSFWYKNFDEMALKTMLRQLLSKYGILSAQMQTAYEYDQSVVEDNKPRYVDNDDNSERMNNDSVQEQNDVFDVESHHEEVIEQEEVMQEPQTINFDDLM